ncbi:hypothetical protein [Marinimicrobium locisalis]|uniref:hypothetical protein n=1 Tax=Marinimicrobium locisalis TaxID=546022 RepID=UPI003221E9A4
MRRTIIAIAAAALTAGAVYYHVDGNQERAREESKPTRPAYNDTQKRRFSKTSDEQAGSSEQKSTPEQNQTPKETPSLPHWKKIFSDYKVPQKNFSGEVDRILETIKDDPSGKPERGLFRILDYCSLAAKNKQQLQELKALHEKTSLMEGRGNGATLYNINRAVSRYNECKSLEDKDLQEAYDYLEASAAKGDPKAKTVLATLYEPNDFSSWTKKEKEAYRHKMTKNLDEARASCEPRAFHAYAHGLGEGHLWQDDSDIPKNIRTYSNLLVRGMIYANKSEGAEGILASDRNQLKSIASEMTKNEVAESEKYGRDLYGQSCE